MKIIYYSLIVLLLCLNTACAQINMETYEGNWTASIDNPKAFSFYLSLKVLTESTANLQLSNGTDLFDKNIPFKSGSSIQFKLSENISFEGQFNKDQTELTGFMKSGTLFYHLVFKLTAPKSYTAQWNFFLVEELTPSVLYLSVEEASGEDYVAYPIFTDNRFGGTWATDFKKDGDKINFYDFKGGLSFEGQLLDKQIKLNVLLGTTQLATFNFTPSTDEWTFGQPNYKKSKTYEQPIQTKDGWDTAPLDLTQVNYDIIENMLDSIHDNTLTYVHSLLIAKEGKLVFEKYFNGHNANIGHDQRSAAKSIYSATIGIAIDQGIIKSVDDPIYNYLPDAYQYTKDKQKAKITFQDCLTMSSGIDAIDFGIKRKSVATEDNYQNSPDWAKTVLEAPMIFESGTHANYASANPFLLGLALGNTLEVSLESYIDKHLLRPMNFSKFYINTDEKGQVYFGGGMHITSRDMLKFGQLYLSDGQWKGQQLISKKWIEESSINYRVLDNTTEKNGYGYLWWHDSYEVDGKVYHSIEARGAGGQLIAFIKELDVVITMTSGNFRNGRYWQPQMMMREYILPALVGKMETAKK